MAGLIEMSEPGFEWLERRHPRRLFSAGRALGSVNEDMRPNGTDDRHDEAVEPSNLRWLISHND
jgi:hypothetical protein